MAKRDKIFIASLFLTGAGLAGAGIIHNLIRDRIQARNDLKLSRQKEMEDSFQRSRWDLMKDLREI